MLRRSIELLIYVQNLTTQKTVPTVYSLYDQDHAMILLFPPKLKEKNHICKGGPDAGLPSFPRSIPVLRKF